MQRKRGGSNNWIGIVVFLTVMFGSTIARSLSNIIFQATGMRIDSNILFIGLIVLAVLISSFSSIIRKADQVNQGTETKLPTTPSMPPPTSMSEQRPPVMPSESLPGSPRFEPVVDPRILIFGIFGIVFFGVIFLFILAMTGAI